MGYYEVRYRVDNQTKTTSGHNLSSVKQRVRDRGGTLISSKYVSTSRRATRAEREGIVSAESNKSSEVTQYNKKTSGQGETQNNQNILEQTSNIPIQLGDTRPGYVREQNISQSTWDKIQSGTEQGEQIGSTVGEASVSKGQDRTSMTGEPSDLPGSFEGAFSRAKGTSNSASGRDISSIQSSNLPKSRVETWEPKKPGDEMSVSEYKADLRSQRQNMRQYFIDDPNDNVFSIPEMRRTGEKFIGFEPEKNTSYEVQNFQPRFLYGYTTKERGSTKVLSGHSADIYLENLGRFYKQNANKMETDLNSNISDIDTQLANVGDWYPDTTIRKIKTDEGGYRYEIDFPFSGAEHFYSTKENIRERGGLGLFATSLTPSDPLGLKSAYYMAIGDKEKAWAAKVAGVADTKRPFHEFYLSSPMGIIGTSYAAAVGVTAGIGAVSAVSPTVGWGTSTMLGTYFIYETGKNISSSVGSAMESGDYGSLVGSGTQLGLGIGSGIAGARVGYRLGYGRTSEWLYGRANYTPGSADYIRYKNTLKTARRLQLVKSKDMSPLDFTKDVMRMTPKSSQRLMSYLEAHPESVLGGSSSQYTQTSQSLWRRFAKYRGSRGYNPRDIDFLVKNQMEAKTYIGRLRKVYQKGVPFSKRPHRIDIHGFDMGGKGGRYYEFGFETQRPIKIGKYRYMRLGEQVFRKGISSVKLETQYRWYKDTPDFKMASEQLISSGQQSYNPVSRIRAYIGSRSYQYVLNPSKAPGYTTRPGFISRVSSGFAKRVYTPPEIGVPSAGGYPSGYSYPISSYMPSYSISGLVGSYIPSTYFPSKKTGYTPVKYTPLKVLGYKPSSYKKTGYTQLDTTTYKPLSYKTPKSVSYIIPSYKPPKKMGYTMPKTPRYKPLGYKSSGYPTPTTFFSPPPPNKEFFDDDFGKKKRQIKNIMRYDMPSYRFRKFRIPNFNKILRGYKL